MKFNTKMKQKIIHKKNFHILTPTIVSYDWSGGHPNIKILSLTKPSSDWLIAHTGMSTLTLAEISYLKDFSINPLGTISVSNFAIFSLLNSS